MRVAIIFDNFGPYHLARLKAASQVCTVLALEVNHRSRDYAWQPNAQKPGFDTITLDQIEPGEVSKMGGPYQQLRRTLANFQPDCVFVPGWSRGYALASLAWCIRHRIPAVLMSESTEHDLPRSKWKEWLKARFVSRFSSGLVGGTAQLEYLAKLGMPVDRIFRGYDVVDNDYFRRGAAAARGSCKLRSEMGLPKQYFLASARFVERKNLARLLQAYAGYRQSFLKSDLVDPRSGEDRPWSLVLLGDGPEKALLERLIFAWSLDRHVLLPGFRQYSDLPVYYGLASAFVHASTSEPWGLVVNEAMASELPVVVSETCGCAPDLVRDSANGFMFDPQNIKQLSELLRRVSSNEAECSSLGKMSSEIISHWGPNRFAQGLQAAAEKAVNLKNHKTTAWPGMLFHFRTR